MKKLLLPLLTFLFAAYMISCKSTDEDLMPKNDAVVLDTAMYPELILFFDSMDVKKQEDVGPDKIILPNGRTIKDFTDEYFPELFAQHRSNSGFNLSTALLKVTEDKGPQTTKMLLIAALYARASQLVYSFGPWPNGQAKLAYVYNGKNESNSKAGDNSVCKEALYGLDCSGFMSRVFEDAGINLPAGSYNQADPKQIKAALDKKFKDKSAKIEVTSEEVAAGTTGATGKIESGDIIAFYEPIRDKTTKKIIGYSSGISHIGFAYQDASGEMVILNSYGSQSQSCADNKKKGPTALAAGTALKWWPKFRIVRFTIDISGKWGLYGRCEGQSEDKLSLNLTFSKESGQSNSFTATGSGIDYDGTTPFDATITGNYNSLKSTMENCQIQFQFPTHVRTDVIPSINISGIDETGYILATCTANCGCPLEVRFKNMSK